MKLIRDLATLPVDVRSGAVAIGNFDGVHLGHARIVERLIARARGGGPGHRVHVRSASGAAVAPELAPPPLTWTDRKAQLLARLGVDAVIAYPTDQALLALAPEQFFDSIVRRGLGARAMVEGSNFYFGHHRSGTIDVLRRLTHEAGIVLEVVEPVVVAGDAVSSSRVRRLVGEGRVAEARALLTEPYRIRGEVVAGAGRGATIGFPTANLHGVDTILPALGVYAGCALVDERTWPAAIHIGPNPTFGEQDLKVEVHLIGWQGSLVGRVVEVDFWVRLRGTRRFGSMTELTEQLARDVARASEIAGSHAAGERATEWVDVVD